MDPHATAVLIPVNQSDIILGTNRDTLIDLSVAVGIIREHGHQVVALARSDRVQSRCITILRIDSRSVLCLRLNHLTVHEHARLDPFVNLDIKQIEVAQRDLTLATVSAMNEHEATKARGCVVHALFRWDS